MKAVMMFLCPVVGPMFVLLSFILFKLFSSQGMDLSDIVFSKDRTENFLRPDEEMERNMVSLEEALEVTDKKSLRTLMLNVIRGDYQNSLSSINLALNSKDSETAHYAASILQDVLNNFRSQVQKKYLLCQEENEQQVENCVNLVEYMNPILENNHRTGISDMDQIVYRRSADIHFYFSFFQRYKFLFSACQCVKNLHVTLPPISRFYTGSRSPEKKFPLPVL